MKHSDVRFPLAIITRAALGALALGAALSLGSASGQTVPAPQDAPAVQPPTIQQVQTLVQQQRFPEAESMVRAIVSQQPGNGQAWFYLGYSLHIQGKLDEALPAHIVAAGLGQGQTRLLGLYNTACVYSLKDDKDKAFEWLERAFQAGYRNTGQIDGDSDFDNIRADKRYQPLLDRMDDAPSDGMAGGGGNAASGAPSVGIGNVIAAAGEEWTSRAVRRQLDFWLGPWDAIDAKGQRVGANVITLAENGMIVHESWTGAQGGTGQSINYYDPAGRVWRQAWVFPNGGVVHYQGNFKDGAFRYEGEHIAPDGAVAKAICTLTPLADGRIHHVIKHSKDGGTTWETYFDAHYVRQGMAPPDPAAAASSGGGSSGD